eukprot:GAHX01002159.1.p1 GENE.GAHX01002159.1~~GAHX01002159.1.p1  ORF type:complete len:993 (-),score=220.87 GAHX01002159.1:39-3017(-)
MFKVFKSHESSSTKKIKEEITSMLLTNINIVSPIEIRVLDSFIPPQLNEDLKTFNIKEILGIWETVINDEQTFQILIKVLFKSLYAYFPRSKRNTFALEEIYPEGFIHQLILFIYLICFHENSLNSKFSSHIVSQLKSVSFGGGNRVFECAIKFINNQLNHSKEYMPSSIADFMLVDQSFKDVTPVLNNANIDPEVNYYLDRTLLFTVPWVAYLEQLQNSGQRNAIKLFEGTFDSLNKKLNDLGWFRKKAIETGSFVTLTFYCIHAHLNILETLKLEDRFLYNLIIKNKSYIFTESHFSEYSEQLIQNAIKELVLKGSFTVENIRRNNYLHIEKNDGESTKPIFFLTDKFDFHNAQTCGLLHVKNIKETDLLSLSSPSSLNFGICLKGKLKFIYSFLKRYLPYVQIADPNNTKSLSIKSRTKNYSIAQTPSLTTLQNRNHRNSSVSTDNNSINNYCSFNLNTLFHCSKNAIDNMWDLIYSFYTEKLSYFEEEIFHEKNFLSFLDSITTNTTNIKAKFKPEIENIVKSVVDTIEKDNEELNENLERKIVDKNDVKKYKIKNEYITLCEIAESSKVLPIPFLYDAPNSNYLSPISKRRSDSSIYDNNMNNLGMDRRFTTKPHTTQQLLNKIVRNSLIIKSNTDIGNSFILFNEEVFNALESLLKKLLKLRENGQFNEHSVNIPIFVTGNDKHMLGIISAWGVFLQRNSEFIPNPFKFVFYILPITENSISKNIIKFDSLYFKNVFVIVNYRDLIIPQVRLTKEETTGMKFNYPANSANLPFLKLINYSINDYLINSNYIIDLTIWECSCIKANGKFNFKEEINSDIFYFFKEIMIVKENNKNKHGKSVKNLSKSYGSLDYNLKINNVEVDNSLVEEINEKAVNCGMIKITSLNDIKVIHSSVTLDSENFELDISINKNKRKINTNSAFLIRNKMLSNLVEIECSRSNDAFKVIVDGVTELGEYNKITVKIARFNDGNKLKMPVACYTPIDKISL